jgi:HNH endonuclease/AP2 domain
MTSLNIIEEFLHIQIGDKQLKKGKNKENKNKYYYYQNRYYIVSLPNEKWIIMSTNNQTRELLTNHILRNSEGYAQTDINDSTKKLHQLLLVCPENMVVDHIKRNKFDNRLSNLRIVTVRDNNRNKSKPNTNISGFVGVCKEGNNWVAFINDDQGKKRRKSFSCKKYGEHESLEMAKNQRAIWKQEFRYLGE